MDSTGLQRMTHHMANEAQLCRMLAAQLSIATEAEALLRQAMRLEAAVAAAQAQTQAQPR